MRIAALALLTTLSSIAMSQPSLVYIATQNPDQPGIMRAAFDPATGTLGQPTLAIATRDPAHFTMSTDGRHLYMCNTGTPGGISAFAVDPNSGDLTLQNHIESRGRGPSYVAVDGTGRFVLDANYGGGYVEVLSLAADGSLEKRTAIVQHTGASAHPQRQTKPYAHWIRTDPTNRFALAADLGTDQIMIYRFDVATGGLAPHDPPAATAPPGSGPRHLAFHPNGRWVYAVQELSNEILAFRWDAAKGVLTRFQAVETLAEGFAGASTAAEIAVRADGRFVYASNRGEDTLVVYRVADSGELELVQRETSGGKVPRYFSFDPTNQWLLVTNQESGNVVVFRVDERTGRLARHGQPVALPRPMGVVFAPK